MMTFPYERNILERDVNQQTNKQSKLQMVLMKAAIFSPVGIQDESQHWSVESFSNFLYYAMSLYVSYHCHIQSWRIIKVYKEL